MKNTTFPGPFFFFSLAFFGSIATVSFIISGCVPNEPAEVLEIKHENVIKVLFHNYERVTIMKKVENSTEIELVAIYGNIKYFADVPPDKPMWAIMTKYKNVGSSNWHIKNTEIHLHDNLPIGGGDSGGKNNHQTTVIE